MYKYFLILSSLFFTACSTSYTNVPKSDSNEVKTVKEYKEISQDAIFEAAKKVFLLAGKGEFRIDSYRNSLVVSKTKMHHYLFNAFTSEDRWELSIKEENNISMASLKVKRIIQFDEENAKPLEKSLHTLLFNRIDFLLGLNDSWDNCTYEYIYDSTICDAIDLTSYDAPTKDDMIENIYIADRKPTQTILEIEDDVLNDDIVLSLDETDLLDPTVNNEDTLSNDDESSELDKEIDELNEKVNVNINKTLDDIETEMIKNE